MILDQVPFLSHPFEIFGERSHAHRGTSFVYMFDVFDGNDEKERTSILLFYFISLRSIDLLASFMHTDTVYQISIVHRNCALFINSRLQHRQVADSYFRPLVSMLDA